FLTEYIDIKTNFYFPISGYKNLGSQVTHTFGSRSILAHERTTFEEPVRGQIGGANTVDSSNPLSSNPN
ncbi:MAG: hypothetical protein V3S04_05740, partial [Candidatus Omnitrophota bacterium]